MFNVTESWIMPVNLVFFLFLAMNMYLGYRTGVLRRVIALVGTVVSFYGSWLVAGIVSEYVRIVPRSWIPFDNFKYSQLISRFVNEVAWYVILFVAVRFIFFLIDIAARGLQKIGPVHIASSILGMVFSVVETCMLVLAVCVVLNSPFFTNGNELMEKSVLGTVKGIGESVLQEVVSPVIESDAFAQLYNDASNLTQEQLDNLRAWMEERGYEDIEFQ